MTADDHAAQADAGWPSLRRAEEALRLNAELGSVSPFGRRLATVLLAEYDRRAEEIVEHRRQEVQHPRRMLETQVEHLRAQVRDLDRDAQAAVGWRSAAVSSAGSRIRAVLDGSAEEAVPPGVLEAMHCGCGRALPCRHCTPTAAHPVTLAWTPDQNWGRVSVLAGGSPVWAIVALARAGEPHSVVAAEYGVDEQTVDVVVRLADDLADTSETSSSSGFGTGRVGSGGGKTPTSRPDPDCGNCAGVGCMDCRTRTVHDDCVNDCPVCCPEEMETAEPRARIVADQIRKAIVYRLGVAAVGPLGSAADLGWLLAAGSAVVAALDSAALDTQLTGQGGATTDPDPAGFADRLARALHDADCGCGDYDPIEDPRYADAVRAALAWAGTKETS